MAKLKTHVAIKHFYREQNQQKAFSGLTFPDNTLLFCLLCLLAIGLTMVASASIPKTVTSAEPLQYFNKQLIFVLMGLVCGLVAYALPVQFWYKNSYKFLFLGMALLILVLIPGIGRSINGASRWIALPGFNMQVSEVMRIVMIIYTAAFLTRNQNQIQRSFLAMLRLMLVLGLVCALLLLEPDFGASVVLVATVLGMLFVAGVCLVRFGIGAALVVVSLVVVMFLESYRVKRLLHYTDPFKYIYGEGYQLSHSLIAIGRGETFGVGLGESIQKHQYLPEAHTDFIFSVFAEEMGLIGVVSLIVLYLLIVWRAFMIAGVADSVRMRFGSCVAYGIGIWLALQFIINMSVASGLLPTKGLTLPFISYGGSAMVSGLVLLAILLRIGSEANYLKQREREKQQVSERVRLTGMTSVETRIHPLVNKTRKNLAGVM